MEEVREDSWLWLEGEGEAECGDLDGVDGLFPIMTLDRISGGRYDIDINVNTGRGVVVLRGRGSRVVA